MTIKTIALPAIAVLGLALGGAALAQGLDAAIDTNGDGMYSFPELTIAVPALTAAAFTTMDTSGDGLLDVTEVAAAIEAGTMAPSEG